MNEQIERIVNGLKFFFQSSGHKRAVLGLSGGIDSALTAKLAVMAIGQKNITALILPHSAITSKESIEDAEQYALDLGIKNYRVPIDEYVKLYDNLPWKPSKLANINIQARIRATILYHYSNTHDCLVLGTGNKTELNLGYFTKFGDGACDILPIGNLYKTEVWKMSEELGLPQKIIQKAPSAELAKAQTDEGEIGMSYGEMDDILRHFEAGGKAFSEKEKMLAERVKGNMHKSQLPRVF